MGRGDGFPKSRPRKFTDLPRVPAGTVDWGLMPPLCGGKNGVVPAQGPGLGFPLVGGGRGVSGAESCHRKFGVETQGVEVGAGRCRIGAFWGFLGISL